MASQALTDALTQIATAANAALAALAAEDEPAPETRDYQADELERIEATTAAQVAVIEAEAAATVAIIEAETAAAPTVDGLDLDPGELADVLDLDLGPADVDPGELGTELLGAEPPAENLADAADLDTAIDTAVDVLDALPTLEPVAVPDDFPPSPTHWYKRPLFAAR